MQSHEGSSQHSKIKNWQEQLASWAIPKEIIEQAPTSPWIHPVELFEIDPDQALKQTPATAAALAGLKDEKSVLDIGCGGGKATFELAGHIKKAIGVDHQSVMLDRYRETAKIKNIEVETYLGDWPQIESVVPIAEVVLVHHVLYNVSDIENFVKALNKHASSRVVLELPVKHPLSAMNPYWKHFWNIERPAGPTAEDALEIIKDFSKDPKIQYYDAPNFKEVAIEKMVEFNRIRLCLTVEKDQEILEFTKNQPSELRKLATIWWDI
jgi:SAM-dependent methyltransferase